MTAFPLHDVTRQKYVFSSLALSYSKNHVGGCSKLWQAHIQHNFYLAV